MTRLIAADGQWPVVVAKHADRPESGVSARTKPGDRSHRLPKMLGLLDDAVLLLLVLLLFPLSILLLGAPVALLVRLLVELASRL